MWNVNKDQEKGGAVVVFRSDYINEALVNLRTAQADVKFKSISGLRVSSSAIRFEGIQKGVYIIRGEKLAFRPVDVLYEGRGSWSAGKPIPRPSPTASSNMTMWSSRGRSFMTENRPDEGAVAATVRDITERIAETCAKCGRDRRTCG